MRKSFLLAAAAIAALAGAPKAWAQSADPSPCQDSLTYLTEQYESDAVTRTAFADAYAGLKALPPGYSYQQSTENPWKRLADEAPGDDPGKGLFEAVKSFYAQVCTALPQISGTNDNALDSIQYFAWLYNDNPDGVALVQGGTTSGNSEPVTSVASFLVMFNEQYKDVMDGEASAKDVPQWIADPRIEIDDYVKLKPSEYTSWNDFFSRNLKYDPVTGTYPSRPVTMPGRDYVIVSPTDCIMNPLVQVLQSETGELTRKLIENPLSPDDVIDVKGVPMLLDRILANTPQALKDKFAGGTGLSCVLMPNTYHHFHSPVDGTIRHAEIVEPGTEYAFGTFGYDNWANWVPTSGDVGRPGTDFSQFQGFTRGVIIIEVTYNNLPADQRPKDAPSPELLKGYVASIPVGLDTVGSVAFRDDVVAGKRVTKGVTEFGNFYYGGSLNILLFSKIEGFDAPMVTPAVQTRMGNQIGILNTPYPPAPTPWTPD